MVGPAPRTNAAKHSSTVASTYTCRHSPPRSTASISVGSYLAHPINVSPRRQSQLRAPRALAEQPLNSASQRDIGSADAEFLNPSRSVRVLIAGGGIAGLVLAVALLKKGVDVRVYEQDMTAIRGEGKYRGPIQVRLPYRLLPHQNERRRVDRASLSPMWVLHSCVVYMLVFQTGCYFPTG